MNRPCWWISAGVTLAAFVASLVVYSSLPAQVPTHRGFDGKPDSYGPKEWAAFLVPGLMVVMLGVLALLPILSPKNFRIEPFRGTYERIVVIVMLMFGYMQIAVLAGAARPDFPVGRFLIAGIFLALAGLGNLLGKVQRNFWVGIRVPWTLASERVWNDTHRMGAWVFTVGSLIGFLLALFDQTIAAFILLILIALIPIIYSFVHYKNLERKGEI
jgi:uncharacterized membrane protein